MLLRMNVLEVGRVAVRRLPVGTARVLTRGRGRCCRGCHVGGVELLGRGRLGRGMRSLGRAPVGAVLLVTLEEMGKFFRKFFRKFHLSRTMLRHDYVARGKCFEV